MQMAQLPLVIAGRAKVFKRHPALGNVRPLSLSLITTADPAQLIFWLGLMSGCAPRTRYLFRSLAHLSQSPC